MVKKVKNRSQEAWEHHTVTWIRTVTREEFKAFRIARKPNQNSTDWSAADYGKRLAQAIGRARNFSGNYISKLESGAKEFTPNIIQAFRALQSQEGEAEPRICQVERVIISRTKIPQVTKASARTRLCKGHRLANFFYTPNQLYCGTTQAERDECRKLFLKQRRAHYARTKKKNRVHRAKAKRRTVQLRVRRMRQRGRARNRVDQTH